MGQELNVAVIGAGYAGMAAAVGLADCGIPVTVFESAQHVGGRARGLFYNDTHLDNGQHLFLGCYHNTLHLIKKVGGNIQEDFLRTPLQLILNGEFSLRTANLPSPLNFLFGLLNAQGLRFGERIEAVRFIRKLESLNYTLGQDLPVADLLRRFGQGTNVTRKLWAPLCIAALNTPIDSASGQVMVNVLRDALGRSRRDSDMLFPRTDLSKLFPSRAASFVEQRCGEIRLACGVEALRPSGSGIEVTTERGTSLFTHAICAAPPAIATRLIRPIGALAEMADQIDALEHQPIYTIYLQYPAAVGLSCPMVGLHGGFAQWVFDKGMIAGQSGLLAAVISAQGSHQELSLDQLAQRVILELNSEFGIGKQPRWHKVIAERRATFSCTPNLQRPLQITPLPCLLLAGDYTRGDYPATLEGAVISGLKCADIITSG
jgi:squalene-associated FAD-dependent desaturase